MLLQNCYIFIYNNSSIKMPFDVEENMIIFNMTRKILFLRNYFSVCDSSLDSQPNFN